MKKSLYIMTLIVAMAFLGCGGSDDTESPTSQPPVTNPVAEKALELNIKTEVTTGEVYEARSSDARIDIEHDLIHNKRYITLIQGQGVIIE